MIPSDETVREINPRTVEIMSDETIEIDRTIEMSYETPKKSILTMEIWKCPTKHKRNRVGVWYETKHFLMQPVPLFYR